MLFVAALPPADLARDLLAMFNQLSGINAILYYLNDIFAKPPASTRCPSDLQAVAIGAANLIVHHRSR